MLDPFGGSGSTLIACEKASREARLIELDPKYVDTLILRWQEFSGGTAILNDDGRSYEEIAARCDAAASGSWPSWSYGESMSLPLPAVMNALMMLTSTP